MEPDTTKRLAAIFDRFPHSWSAESVPTEEIDRAEARLGVPFPPGYREFLTRFGGGHAGSLPVAGLRRWDAARYREWSVVELTESHRAAHWPGTEAWAVFSGDGFGNPVGFDADGRVWLSDSNSRECVCLEATFEDWRRRWALRVDPHRGEYLTRQAWPG